MGGMGDIGLIAVVGGIGLYLMYAYNKGAFGTPGGTVDPGITTTPGADPGIVDPGLVTGDMTPVDYGTDGDGATDTDTGADADLGDPVDTGGITAADPGPGVVDPDDPIVSILTPDEEDCKAVNKANTWNKVKKCCNCPGRNCYNECPAPAAPTPTANKPAAKPKPKEKCAGLTGATKAACLGTKPAVAKKSPGPITAAKPSKVKQCSGLTGATKTACLNSYAHALSFRTLRFSG